MEHNWKWNQFVSFFFFRSFYIKKKEKKIDFSTRPRKSRTRTVPRFFFFLLRRFHLTKSGFTRSFHNISRILPNTRAVSDFSEISGRLARATGTGGRLWGWWPLARTAARKNGARGAAFRVHLKTDSPALYRLTRGCGLTGTGRRVEWTRARVWYNEQISFVLFSLWWRSLRRGCFPNVEQKFFFNKKKRRRWTAGGLGELFEFYFFIFSYLIIYGFEKFAVQTAAPLSLLKYEFSTFLNNYYYFFFFGGVRNRYTGPGKIFAIGKRVRSELFCLVENF